jgi:hypothetical protein
MGWNRLAQQCCVGRLRVARTVARQRRCWQGGHHFLALGNPPHTCVRNSPSTKQSDCETVTDKFVTGLNLDRHQVSCWTLSWFLPVLQDKLLGYHFEIGRDLFLANYFSCAVHRYNRELFRREPHAVGYLRMQYVHSKLRESPPLWQPTVHLPFLSQMNQPMFPCPIFLLSILILSFHLRLGLPNGPFSTRFATNILYAFLVSPIRATCLAHHNIIVVSSLLQLSAVVRHCSLID